ncbi:hypothetical protein HY949_01870 [Candidatus Gottesmanbacteria bacterium]|nr:hypothetical protein [Candidatus Gottesmanbacteria bacterium]
MPKKTKKEKIIAQYRRKLSRMHEPVPEAFPHQVNTLHPVTKSPTSPFIFQAKPHAAFTNASIIQPMDQAIRRDLIKTLVLAAMAIGGEIILSIIVPS